MVSVELLTVVKYPLYLKFIKEREYMQWISHPKMLTTSNLKLFKKFVRKVFGLYTIETDFVKLLPKQ